MFISDETKLLAKDLIENHKDWKQYDHTYHNKRSDVSIWVSNGVLFIDFYPNVNAFNTFEKRLIHKAIRKSIIFNTIDRGGELEELN